MPNTVRPTDQQQCIKLTITHLPDELLLEVFDSYRQSIDQYDHKWRKKYAWLNLAHVCTRWRAVVFASSSRLDVNIIVGPEKPGHIKAFLSGHLPILIDYSHLQSPITDRALWRMCATLQHRNRVREISFEGSNASFKKFFRAADHHFPALESLFLNFPYGHDHELDIPATFLRGLDQSDLRLRRLTLQHASLPSVSRFLLSATALTDLTLIGPAGFASSQASLFLACLQGLQCLRSLDLQLITPHIPRDIQYQHLTPEEIVPLSKLTRFHYSGSTIFLDNLISRLSAPSLQDARFALSRTPLLYLSRVIDNVTEEFRSVRATVGLDYFHLSSSTHSAGEFELFKPSFTFTFSMTSAPDLIQSINSTPSTKLAMTEELALFFRSSSLTNWGRDSSLREFLRQFHGLRVLRVETSVRKVGRYLWQDAGEAILPVLEEIKLSMLRSKKYRRRAAQALAAFEPFVSERERAGRLVKVSLCER